MKKILLGISFLLAFALFSLAQPRLYFDFEGAYSTNPAFTDYGTTYGGVVLNPSKTGENLSDSVGVTKTGSQTYNGFKYTFDQPLDLSAGDGTFTLMVYHPTKSSTKVRIQVQGATLNVSTEGKLDKPYTTPGQWQKITWTISKELYDNKVTAVLFCINEGTALAGEQWYFDEFRGPDQYPPLPPQLYFDFEGEAATNPLFTDYGTTYGGVMLNPSKSGENLSDSVGVTTTGSQTYNGFKYTFEQPLDLSEGDGIFTLMVYHPTKASTKVRIQVQGATLNPGTEGKLDMPYTTPGEWQRITWTISKELYDNKVTAVLFCINEGAALAGEQWYFDEFMGPEQYAPPAKPEGLYFDFEGAVETHPVLTESGAKYNGVKMNPLKDAVNPSDSVGMTTTGSQTYNGIKYSFAQPLDLSKGDGTFTLMVYHPTKASTKVRIQVLGDALNSSSEGKLDMPYTTPGAWEKITWTVSKDLYDKKVTAVLFCINEGVALADEEWYFDEFTGPDQYAPPAEIQPLLYYSTEKRRQNCMAFQGATYAGVVENPKTDDINSNMTAGKSTTGTDTWSGIYFDLPSTIDFSLSQKFTMMVYSDSVGYVRLQFEKPGVTKKMRLSVLYDTPGVWKELTFDPEKDNVGDPLMDDTWSRMVIIFDDKDKDVGEGWFFDNLRGPVLSITEPVHEYYNFETLTPPNVRTAGAVFGGVFENPNPSGINVTDSVGLFYTGTITYASIYWDLPGTIDFSNGTEFTMMVYSDSIGRARIQLEKAGNTSTQCKIFAEYTTPGEWQKLTFDATTGGQNPLRDNYYNRMVVVFDNTDTDPGEEWYFDQIVGPDMYHSYYVDTKFTVTVTDATPASIKIDINNSGEMIDMFDDGTNGDAAAADGIWTVMMSALPVGDHVYDFYVDNTMTTNGNDVPFSLPETTLSVTIPINYSLVTSVKENLAGKINIYPNPANDHLIIESPGRIVSLKVYNMNGSEIINTRPGSENRVILNTSQLMPGVFVVRVMDDTGKLYTNKFIKK